MDALVITLRLVFAVAVVAALILPRLEGIAPVWRNVAIAVALAMTLTLLGLRMSVRARTPERLPSSTG